MPTRDLSPQTKSPVPIEYSGLWIAWSADHAQIVAQSDNLQDLWRQMQERRIPDPIFEKVPRADARFVGKR